MVEDGSRAPPFIHDDDRTHRTGGAAAEGVARVHTVASERIENEAGAVIVAERSRKGACRAQPGGGHERRGAKPAAVPFARPHRDLSICRRIGRDVEDVVHRGAAEAQNVKTLRHRSVFVQTCPGEESRKAGKQERGRAGTWAVSPLSRLLAFHANCPPPARITRTPFTVQPATSSSPSGFP